MDNPPNLPATLDAASAQLPQRYEAARTAIAECDRIDECKDWADKHAALASYAAQAKDDSLAVYARRIQARALRRAGELIKQIPAASVENLQQHRRAGAGPSVTRTQAAADAGMSNRQRKTALRVAAIPDADFDYAVESQDPPTVSQLAALGTQSRTPPIDQSDGTDEPGPQATPNLSEFIDAEESARLEHYEAEERERLERILSADDQFGTAARQLKQIGQELIAAKQARDRYMTESAAKDRALKTKDRDIEAQRKAIARLEGEVQRLEGENEALRERIAIMEVG